MQLQSLAEEEELDNLSHLRTPLSSPSFVHSEPPSPSQEPVLGMQIQTAAFATRQPDSTEPSPTNAFLTTVELPATAPATPAGSTTLESGVVVPACIRIDTTSVVDEVNYQLLSPDLHCRSAKSEGFATVLREMTRAGIGSHTGHPTRGAQTSSCRGRQQVGISQPTGGLRPKSHNTHQPQMGYIAQHRRMPMPTRPPPGSRTTPKARSGPQKWIKSASKPLCDRTVTKTTPTPKLRQRPASAPPVKIHAMTKLAAKMQETPQSSRIQRRQALQERAMMRPASAMPARSCKFNPARAPAKAAAAPGSQQMLSRAAKTPILSHRGSGKHAASGTSTDKQEDHEQLLCDEPEELSAEVEHASNLIHERAIMELLDPPPPKRPQSAYSAPRGGLTSSVSSSNRDFISLHGAVNMDLFAGLRLNDLTTVQEETTGYKRKALNRVVASWELKEMSEPLEPQLEFHARTANKWTRERPHSAAVKRMQKYSGRRPKSAMSAAESVRDQGPPVRDRVARV